ncbi:MAG TPA: metallopeptidase family protein [Tissierellaceae bacterium]|nr:metallopeptidase family protein [Tissierellaceae bacterium]
MDSFPDIEKVHYMLDNIVEEIPKEFFRKLNEGVVLLSSHKLHPESRKDIPLYIMGEYSRSITGRNIKIYYGSFKMAYNGQSEGYIYKKLKETLLHEFIHHLESLAGEKRLEIKDAEDLERYRNMNK